MINYYLITKPGIIFGNLLAVVAGFLLGSRNGFDLILFLETVIGIALIIASACVFNNYIDRNIDVKMRRTRQRAIASGVISERQALLFGIILGAIGFIVLLLFTNLLTVAAAVLGFVVYVLLYSRWKCRTIYGTAIGSIAGATPPVVGYCAASGQVDLAAALLFAMLVLWQMPHFFAIALLHLDDYTQAGIPVLPVVRGIYRTKIHTLLYILAFIPVMLLFTYFGYTGTTFLTLTTLLGVAWLIMSILGFSSSTKDKQWARRMFLMSLLVMGAACLAIPIEAALSRHTPY